MVWPFKSTTVDGNGNVEEGKLLDNNSGPQPLKEQECLEVTTTEDGEQQQDEGFQSKYKYAPKQQDQDIPMDLGTLQDIFSFGFMRGRPILNFIIAILWSIGLPVLLYNLLKPHIGQVLAMIIASAPPLAIVIIHMLKDRTFDPLGFVAGVSFLISGILSIAQPDPKTSAICEGIVPLLVGVSCVISVIPIKIGSFELKPFVFQIANQIMPRNEPDEQLQQQDDNRLANASPPSTGQKRLDYLYTNMAKFRHDMRFMTVSWGLLLIATFIVKVILVETQANISNAQTYGYYMFGIATAVIFVFTWIYTNIVEGHVLSQIAFWKEQQEEQQQMDRETETAANLNWGVNSMSNVFSQVVGGA